MQPTDQHSLVATVDARIAQADRPLVGAPLTGVALYTGAMACIALMDTCAKFLVGDYSLPQMLVMRGAFALLPIAVAVWLMAPKAALPRRHLDLHVLRLVTIAIATALFFDALRSLHLGQAAAIGLLGPVLMALLGARRLGEPIDANTRFLLVAGCGAAAIALAPWSENWQSAPWRGIVSAVSATALYASAMVQTRRLAQAGEASTLMWLTPVGLCIISAPFAVGNWQPDWTVDGAAFAAMGIFGGLSTICIALALHRAPITVVAPFDYSIFLFAAVLGYAVFGTRADAQILLGCLLLTGGLWLLRRSFGAVRRQPPNQCPVRAVRSGY